MSKEVTNYDVDPLVWFSTRQVEYTPAHFITTTSPLTTETMQWVLNNLRGRFSVITNVDVYFMSVDYLGTVSFEDPSEATLYELRWS